MLAPHTRSLVTAFVAACVAMCDAVCVAWCVALCVGVDVTHADYHSRALALSGAPPLHAHPRTQATAYRT